jgi:hypothetical protein
MPSIKAGISESAGPRTSRRLGFLISILLDVCGVVQGLFRSRVKLELELASW